MKTNGEFMNKFRARTMIEKRCDETTAKFEQDLWDLHD
jgi:hypothetical protein